MLRSEGPTAPTIGRARSAAAALVAAMRRGYTRARYGERYAEAIFAHIHERNLWGSAESVSGPGSTLARTGVLRRKLPRLLAALDARSLLDAPCGDFNWMRAVDLGPVAYVGVDIVPALVDRNRREHGGAGREFLRLDLRHDALPTADVVLCRDCLIHLSFADAAAALANFRRSGARHLLATTHESVRENADGPTGGFRLLNLRLPPFCFPPPSVLVTENPATGKCLGAWRLDALPFSPPPAGGGR